MNPSHSSRSLSILSNHLSSQPTAKSLKPPHDDVWGGLWLDELLTPQGVVLRKKTNEYMNKIKPQLIPYINNSEFPPFIIEDMKKLGINGYEVKDFGGLGLNVLDSGALLYELSKGDASIALFMLAHNNLGVATIDHLGNDEQRARMLPDCISFNKIACFGLTEPDNGSDASNLKTFAKKVDGGYLLNGTKRWIGHAAYSGYLAIWARNQDDENKVQCFVVEPGVLGLSFSKIENKYSMRMVQNAEIYMKDVFVPDRNKLDKAKTFASGTNVILEHSRMLASWLTVGTAANAYETSLKYVLQRKQFGKSIASFQIIQEKLSRMLATIEMMLNQCVRVSILMDQNKGQSMMGLIARTKGICTRNAREICQIARELMGGNGILLENDVIKCLMDIEVIHTGEGSYEVNMLVSGRDITGGISAFK